MYVSHATYRCWPCFLKFWQFSRYSIAFLLQMGLPTLISSNCMINWLAADIQLSKKLHGIWLAFMQIFLVKIHNNVTTHFLYDVLHFRQDELRWQCTFPMLNLYILACLSKKIQVTDSISSMVLACWKLGR